MIASLIPCKYYILYSWLSWFCDWFLFNHDLGERLLELCLVGWKENSWCYVYEFIHLCTEMEFMLPDSHWLERSPLSRLIIYVTRIERCIHSQSHCSKTHGAKALRRLETGYAEGS